MDGEIQPQVLRKALETVSDGDGPLVVDVRNATQFERGHLPGSRNVPLPEIPQEIEHIADADHVVTVCPHGEASIKAARIVGAYRDFDGTVESLAGGLDAWDGPMDGGTHEGNESAGSRTGGDGEDDVPF